MKQSLSGGSFTGIYSQEKGRVLHRVSLALRGGNRTGRTCEQRLGEPLPDAGVWVRWQRGAVTDCRGEMGL